MTRSEHDKQEHDELDLDAETVKDLEVEPADGDRVRGGYTGACVQPSAHCETEGCPKQN